MDGLTRLLLFILLLVPAPALASEPTVGDVRREALRYAGLDRSLDRWSARARLRHLLPRISASVGGLDQLQRSTDFDEYLSRDSNGDLLFDAAKTGNDRDERERIDWEVRAWIDFRGLIFDPAELQAAREQRMRAEERRELIAEVHQAYFLRRALVAELRDSDPAKRRQVAAELVRVEAKLDGLTGGWFQRALAGGAR